MNIQKNMPVDGQFIAVWRTKSGLLFSATLRWFGGQLESYNYGCDSWEPECDHGFDVIFLKSFDAVFIGECEHDYDVYPDGIENSKCFKCGEFK